jgi:hypothetical protein
MADTLERELKTYRRLLSTLAADEGKFVVIAGDALVGTYETYADALQAAYQRAGLRPFLVKRIAATEAISYFTRDLMAA